MIIKTKDLDEVRSKMTVGDTFVFETSVWTDTLKSEKVRYAGKIKGVYPHGMEVTFNHNGREQTRWVPYIDVLLAKLNGCIPFISTYRTWRLCEVAEDENGRKLF